MDGMMAESDTWNAMIYIEIVVILTVYLLSLKILAVSRVNGFSWQKLFQNSDKEKNYIEFINYYEEWLFRVPKHTIMFIN